MRSSGLASPPCPKLPGCTHSPQALTTAGTSIYKYFPGFWGLLAMVVTSTTHQEKHQAMQSLIVLSQRLHSCKICPYCGAAQMQKMRFLLFSGLCSQILLIEKGAPNT